MPVSARSLVAPPKGFSDIRYVSGHRRAGRSGKCSGRATAARPMRRRGRAQQSALRRRRRAHRAGCTADASVGLTVQGLPIVKPPYGVLSAINLDRGEIMWQVPHGDTPDNIRNHPALKRHEHPEDRPGGTSGVGLMVTKTLVVMGDPQVTTPPERRAARCCAPTTRRPASRSAKCWMPAPQSGSPMTYSVDGKQYIVVAVSGGNYSGEYIAFRLPGGATRTSSQAR